MILSGLLFGCACLQICIAILNLFLVRLLDWKAPLAQMPLLLREVFQVHAWFISITLMIFGALTLRFVGELAHGHSALACWFAGAIGIFWGIRTILQVSYYSPSHWRGLTGRTLVHLSLLLVYGGFSFTYLWAVFGV